MAATANRLRLIQADFADEDVEARQGHLSDEIQRALNTLVPDERQLFLDELSERFPTWDGNVPLERSATGGAQSLTDQREWQDISFVLERLIELSQTLEDDQRLNLARRLQEAGLTPGGEVHWPDPLVTEMKTLLQMDKDTRLDGVRVLEMAIHLAVFADKLDQLGWRIWKTLAPRSRFRSTDRLKNTMKQFVGGKSDVPLSRNIEDLRHLLASLLAAIGQIGNQVAQQHRRFLPAQIEEIVKMEPGGFLVNFETRCWRRYGELSKDLDNALVDKEVRQIIERFVERAIEAR